MFALCLPMPQSTVRISSAEELKIVRATDTVEHLFTHCLISHPEIAFRENNPYGKYLDQDCLTAKEFEKILYELYRNGYALVDARSTFEETGTKAKRTNFSFPKNKKPLVLSFDDVVYAEKNKGKGMSDKLVLTDSGEIVAYTKDTEKQLHKKEFVPILEDFIKKYPDFSYQNARGIIFLTGFDGILGYRTHRNAPNKAVEISKVKPVVAALKEKGWIFGSHSYSHGHMLKYTAEQMQSDVEKWKNEVEPLVGTTELYAYPYGEWIIGENCEDKRAQVLLNAGFSLFFGVGDRPFYVKMPLSSERKLLFQDRCNMDGVSLRSGKCSRFFDCKAVYDPARPIAYPTK